MQYTCQIQQVGKTFFSQPHIGCPTCLRKAAMTLDLYDALTSFMEHYIVPGEI